MRRFALAGLGLLELAVAAVVILLARQLPAPENITRNFEHVRKATTGAVRQVELLREQVEELRDQDFTLAAKELRDNTRAVAATLQNTRVDFQTLEALASALGDVARGLSGWADTLDAERLKKVSDGLGTTASFLEDNVIGSALKAATSLDEAVAGLEADARRLGKLLQQAPPDLKSARDMHDGLARFDEGLAALERLLKLEHLGAIRDGFSGMQTSLATTAEQVNKIGGFSYPVFKFNGFRAPEVEMKPFWPDGAKIAEGLRKAVGGVEAASKELDALHKDLPAIRAGLDESRKGIARSREALAAGLKQQGEIDSLLKSVPKQSAALAEELPKVGKSFARMLRETQRLKDVSTALRQAQKLLDESGTQWPELAKAMNQSAIVLTAAQKQLTKALGKRDEYEDALHNTAELAKVSAELLPLLTDRLDVRLGEQEHSLEQMASGLAEVNQSLPAVETATTDIIGTLRWLLWLTAALVGLHGAFVIGTNVFASRSPEIIGAVQVPS
jgi:uncharacterized phage infection (PIP) family protein YhgE